MFLKLYDLQNPAVVTVLAVLAAMLIVAGAVVCILLKRYEKRELLMHNVERLLESCGGQLDGLDRHGLTPLMRALATADDHATVEELLKRGADPNHCNASGCTPMMMAADLDRAACIAAFIRAGANDQALDPSGRTALMRAVLAHHPVSVGQFVLGGTELNAQDPQGKTALILAVQVGQADSVRILLDQEGREKCEPVDLSITDHQGNTALSLAQDLGYGEIAMLLRRMGG